MSAPTDHHTSVFSDESLRQLALHGNARAYPKGAVIINEGDVGDSLFMILAGRVKVYVGDDSGREMILDTRGAGDYVGEMTLDGGPRSASVMCLEPTSFSIITRQVLRQAISANPDLALGLISTLISRARLATCLVRDLALLDVYGRVARLLLQLATEQVDGTSIIPPLCQASCRLRNLNFKLRGYNEDEVFRGIYRTSASQAYDPWRPNDTNGRGRFERQLPYVEELDEKENGEQSWSIGSKREAPPGLGR